jgi:hypothetical protein
MAVTNVVQIMCTPFSVWQADFDTIVVDTAQQVILKDPAGIVSQFVDGTVYIDSSYLTVKPSGNTDGAHPLISSTDGANGIINVKFYASAALTGSTTRVLFRILSQAAGFQPPFQTK